MSIRRASVMTLGAAVFCTSVVALPPSATASTSAAAADPTDQIEGGLDQYGDQLAAVFISEAGAKALSATDVPPPSAEVAAQEAGPVAEATKSSGDVVSKAKVRSKVLKIRIASLTSIVADVSMSTELQLEDDGTGNPDDSSWSDDHRLTLTHQNGQWSVTKDEVLPAPDEADPGPGAPLPPDSSISSDDPSATGSTARVLRAQDFPGENRINVSNFVNYALKWTGTPYDGDAKSDFNPDYSRYGNNCANFASQVLKAGGWREVTGNSFQRKSTNKWTHNLRGIAGATYTWFNSGYLYTYANNTNTYGWLDNIWHARPGDLLFVDWDPNGRADGDIDHVMEVTGVTASGEPRVSQKTNNRHNITLTQSIALAQQQKKTRIVWYGLKHL